MFLKGACWLGHFCSHCYQQSSKLHPVPNPGSGPNWQSSISCSIAPEFSNKDLEVHVCSSLVASLGHVQTAQVENGSDVTAYIPQVKGMVHRSSVTPRAVLLCVIWRPHAGVESLHQKIENLLWRSSGQQGTRGCKQKRAMRFNSFRKSLARHHGKWMQLSDLSLAVAVRQVLMATDVASRGLDIPTVDLVVNYELPNQPANYVHRVGRTARAGRKGRSVSFVTQYDIELLQQVSTNWKLWHQGPTVSSDIVEGLAPASQGTAEPSPSISQLFQSISQLQGPGPSASGRYRDAAPTKFLKALLNPD